MTLPRSAVLGMPPSRVRVGEPTHELSQISVLLWVEDEMPVIGHQAIGQQPHAIFLHACFKDTLKQLVVFMAAKYLNPSVCSVEYMVDVSTNIGPLNSWHT